MNALQIISSVVAVDKLYDQLSVGFPTNWLQLEVGEDFATFTHKFTGETIKVDADYNTIMDEVNRQLNINNAVMIPQLLHADNVQQFSINNDVIIAKVNGTIAIREKMEDVEFPITFSFTTEGLKEAISK